MMVSTNFDVDKAVYQLRLDEGVINTLQKDAKKIERVMTGFGVFTVITQNRDNCYPKYSEFYVRPETQYALRLTTVPNNMVRFSIHTNIWTPSVPLLELGEELEKIDFVIKSSGNKFFGKGIVRSEHTEQLMDHLVTLIQEEEEVEDGMEKLGVDEESDPVETKASEMVKEGEAETMDEAREKASSEPEEKVEETEHKEEANAG